MSATLAACSETVTLRQLAQPDLDVLFARSERRTGEHWLTRQNSGEVYVAVAELNGQPIGRIGADFIQNSDRNCARLWAAEVSPRLRSRGIGSRLITHLEEVARARGCVAAELEVDADNLRARALYARLDYRQCDRLVYRFRYRERGRMVDGLDEQLVLRKTFA